MLTGALVLSIMSKLEGDDTVRLPVIFPDQEAPFPYASPLSITSDAELSKNAGRTGLFHYDLEIDLFVLGVAPADTINYADEIVASLDKQHVALNQILNDQNVNARIEHILFSGDTLRYLLYSKKDPGFQSTLNFKIMVARGRAT